MTWQETGYGGYCALGVEWNESNASATTYTIAPTVWRWDYYYADVSSQKFWEALYPEPNGSTGGWTGLSFTNGSGWRKVDTFATRTYTKEKTSKTVTLDVGTNAYFASINDGGFYSIGEKLARFTLTIPAKTSYKVSYNANGGSGQPGNQTKWYGETLTLSSTVPTRTGYTFNGWNTKADGSGTNYAKGASYTGNAALTLYAKWTINTWTVSYNGNGSTSGSTSAQTKTYGQTLTLRSNGYARTNYVFKNWNTAANGSGTTYNAGGSYTANAAATMYAQWYAPYTITYNGNGNTGGSTAAQTKIYNGSVTISSNGFSRTNYDFISWNTNSAGTGTTYNPGATYSTNANLTLYAIWKIAHSNPTISNLLVQRCDQNGALASDGAYCRVSATISADHSTEGYTDTTLGSVKVKVGANAEETVSIDTSETSTVIDFVSANQVSLTSTYSVKLTVTDSKGFSSNKTSTLTVAYFTMHFKEGGKGIAIGKKSVTDNLFDVNMNTNIAGYIAARASNTERSETPSGDTYSNAKLRLEGRLGTALAEMDTGRSSTGSTVSRWIVYVDPSQVTAGNNYNILRFGREPSDPNGLGYLMFDKVRPIISFGTTTASAAFDSVNPGVEFRNIDASQRGRLFFTDYDSVHTGATLVWMTNQGQSWFHTQHIKTTGNVDADGVYVVRWKNMGYNTAPSSILYNGSLQVTDKDNNIIGHVEYAQNTNKSIQHNFAAVRQHNGSSWGWYQCAMTVSSAGAVTYVIHTPANFRSAIGAAASSDRRLKHDITPLGEDAVQFVKDLEPCVYTINGERQVGFIAQDIAGSDPWGTRMAFETEEGLDGLDDWEKMPDGSATWKLDYIRTIPPIAAALKKAMERIDLLEARIEELENGAEDA